MDDCLDPVLNPTYPGRKARPTDIWDRDCTTTIDIKYGEEVPSVTKLRTIGRDQLCLVTINNFSGKTYQVNVEGKSSVDPKLFRLYRLDNTDEIYY